MTAVAERTLPHNLEAERSILGAVLVTSGQALDAVADTLRSDHFFREAHRCVYAAMLRLHTRGEAIDFVTLKEELSPGAVLEDVGGPAYIASLADGVPRATNVAYYSRIVRDKAIVRSVIFHTSKILTAAYEEEFEPAALIDAAERGLLEISERAVPGDLVPAAELVRQIFPVLEQLGDTRRPVTGLSTGIPALDRYTRGLQPGNLVILAGRPSQGKTSLATQIAVHVSRTAPVAFFSVEMSQQEQTFRILSMLGRVDGHRLQCGQLSPADQQQVGAALSDLGQRRFWLDDTGTLSPIQIRSRARRLKARAGVALVVVDYLQLLAHAKANSREEAVATTSRLLKQIARELAVPVVALSQLNRSVEQRQDKKPSLADLRESGSLEQDADLVLLIHRPSAKDEGVATVTPATELIIAKQRNGPTTTIDLSWTAEQYRFAEREVHR